MNNLNSFDVPNESDFDQTHVLSNDLMHVLNNDLKHEQSEKNICNSTLKKSGIVAVIKFIMALKKKVAKAKVPANVDNSIKQSRRMTCDEIRDYLISNRIIYPSNSGAKGTRALGPIGTKCRANLINIYRDFFINNKSNMYEICTPTFETVKTLSSSGHVAKFDDPIVRVDGVEHRADHCVEDYVKEHPDVLNLTKPVNEFTDAELEKVINDNKIFNTPNYIKVERRGLMFRVNDTTYLRPETAQGTILQFPIYYEEHGSLNFGVVQQGPAYRNEAKFDPMIRLNEFIQIEIEYCYDPLEENLTHPYYDDVKNLIIPIVTQASQKSNPSNPEIEGYCIDDAVASGIIVNKIMGYFLGVMYEFLEYLGFKDGKFRFKQQMPGELAHYSKQCFDIEYLSSNGKWLEIAGFAYRSDYDLTNHNENNINIAVRTVVKTKYKIELKESIEHANVNVFDGKIFSSIEEIETDEDYKKLKMDKDISSLINIVQFEETTSENFIPHIIEPSVGIDRLLYAVFDNSLYVDEQTNLTTLNVTPDFSAYLVAVFYDGDSRTYQTYAKKNLASLFKHFSVYQDDHQKNIQEKYHDADKFGIQLSIIIDSKSLEDQSVAIRYFSNDELHRITHSELLKLLNKMRE